MNQKEKYPIPAKLEQLPQEIIDLGKALNSFENVTKRELMDLYNNLVKGACNRLDLLNYLVDCLSQLSLEIKGLQFDLDATKNERDQAITELERFN